MAEEQDRNKSGIIYLSEEEEETLDESSKRKVKRGAEDAKRIALSERADTSWNDILKEALIPLMSNHRARHVRAILDQEINQLKAFNQGLYDKYKSQLKEKYKVKRHIDDLREDDYHRVAICESLSLDLDTQWSELILLIIESILGTTDIAILHESSEVRVALRPFTQGDIGLMNSSIEELAQLIAVLKRDENSASRPRESILSHSANPNLDLSTLSGETKRRIDGKL